MMNPEPTPFSPTLTVLSDTDRQRIIPETVWAAMERLKTDL